MHMQVALFTLLHSKKTLIWRMLVILKHLLSLLRAAGQSRAVSEAELEDIVASLRDGDVDCRSAAAERLFNKAAVDESARLRTTSMGVVQPLVRLSLFLVSCTLQLDF